MIGRTYDALGVFAKAEIHLRGALEIRKELLLSHDPELIESNRLLGSLFADTNASRMRSRTY